MLRMQTWLACRYMYNNYLIGTLVIRKGQVTSADAPFNSSLVKTTNLQIAYSLFLNYDFFQKIAMRNI